MRWVWYGVVCDDEGYLTNANAEHWEGRVQSEDVRGVVEFTINLRVEEGEKRWH